jgi:hypothetical protein
VVATTGRWMGRYRLGVMAATAAAAAAVLAQPALGACGSWQKVPGAPGVRGVLNDVSASSATDVWAVGALGGARTLAERWDGAVWKRVATPNPGRRRGRIDTLFSVAAIAPNDAWAVGEWGSGSAPPLLLHWDGVKWQRRLVPRNARHARLLDIVAISANDVLAVGDTAGGFLRSLHYNGSTWRVGGPAFSEGPHPGLLAVAATAPSDVWAVGSGFGPFFVHFNGAGWQEFSHPRRFGTEVGVAATSTTDAWGVGYTKLGSAIDHWNGTSWKVALRTTRGPLLSVAASAPTDVWAVGSGRSQSGPATAHWNGTTWTQTVIPTTLTSTLRSIVNVPTTTTYWAVGDTEHQPSGSFYRTPLIASRC